MAPTQIRFPGRNLDKVQIGPRIRDAETTTSIKFAFWGVGEGKFMENCPKTLFFPGNFHDNKIWNFCEFYCLKFCCHLGGS